jgi:NAD(P)H-nitrite reductase large subunit
MNLDDPVCLCFHVSRRKVIRFIKVEKPRRASQLSECFGAGTGCGWCRPYLERLMAEFSENSDSRHDADAVSAEELDSLDSLDFDQYQAARKAYRDAKNSDSSGSAE